MLKTQQCNDTEAVTTELSKCKLSDLADGQIGKLQVFRSGKTRLVLGDMVFDVNRGAPSGFLQVVLTLPCYILTEMIIADIIL